MRITIEVVRLGGGYRKAIIGQSYSSLFESWCVDSVFGATDEELVERLKIRLPALKKVAAATIVSGRPLRV